MTDEKKTAATSTHAAHAAKKKPDFETLLKEVDPKSLADEQEALQDAYDAIPTLPSPKDPAKAANVAWLKEKIRTSIGKAEGGVTQAIQALQDVAPFVKKLGEEIAALDEKTDAEKAEKKETAK